MTAHGKKRKEIEDDELRLEDLVSDRWVGYGDTLWVLQIRDTFSTVRKLDDSGKYGWDVVDGPRYVASGIAESVFEAKLIAEKCMPGWTSSVTPDQISRARLNESIGFRPTPEFYAVPESIKKARAAGSGCAYLFFTLGILALVAPATLQTMSLGIYQVIYVIMCGFLFMAGGYEWYRSKVMIAYAMGEKTAGTIFKMTTVLGTTCGLVAFGIGMYILKVGQDAMRVATSDMQSSVQTSIYLSLFLVACTVFTLAMVIISRLVYYNAMQELQEKRTLEAERMVVSDAHDTHVDDVERALTAKAQAQAAARAAQTVEVEGATVKGTPSAVNGSRKADTED